MKWMCSEVVIGDYVFINRLSSAKIKHSRKELTAEASLQLPNLKALLQRKIKTGDQVIVRLGYDDKVYEKFRGYVKSIEPNHPYTIKCEDEMWQMKQQPIEPMSWETVSLKEVVGYIAPGVRYTGYDITLSPFRIDRTVKTKALALQKLKDEFGLDIYYRGKQLYVGLAYSSQVGEVVYNYQRNMKRDGVQLEFKRLEDVKLKVTLISINENNEKVEVSGGDPSGETHTLHFYNKSEAELKQLMEEQLGLLRYAGYRGSFTAFGEPRPLHSMVCDLSDDRYPERNGRFFIDTVEIDYSGSVGYQHTVTLGRRVE
jgi:hypothetical protein